MPSEMEKWEDSGKPVFRMKWCWCWGNVGTVIDGYNVPCVWFTQGYKWDRDASSVLPSTGNSLPYFKCKEPYNCRYPGRNLGVMTEDIRSWRTEKKRGWWLNEPFKTKEYDPEDAIE